MPKSQKKKTSAYADAPFPVVGVGLPREGWMLFRKWWQSGENI
jgi:hypothetical protein